MKEKFLAKTVVEQLEFIRALNYKGLHTLVMELGDDITNTHVQAVQHQLGVILWGIGSLWDHMEDVDPRAGPARNLGTRNRKSMTYKLRKAAKYSYP